jgi:hypothetical protein
MYDSPIKVDEIAVADQVAMLLSEVASAHKKQLQPSATARSKAMRRRREASAQIEHAKQELENSLPVEWQLRSAISERVQSLTAEIGQIDLDTQMADLDVDFARLDLSFLRWKAPLEVTMPERHRNMNGVFGVVHRKIQVPRFAVFTLDSNTLRLSVSEMFIPGSEGGHHRLGYDWKVSPESLQWLTKFYELKTLSDEIWCASHGRLPKYDLTARFTGRIPDEVRTLIKAEQQKNRFDNLVLVCEAEWTAMEYTPPALAHIDPLVVGTLHGQAWLVTAFDKTPVEEFVEKNYAKKKV